MKTREDISYGVVPVRKNVKGEWEFYLIYQLSSLRGDSYWIFPKGHTEGTETPEETAKRELKEETSLEVELVSDKTFNLYYDFMHEDTLIRKTVTFFIGMVGAGAAQVDGFEVVAGDWFPYEVAQDKLTFDDTKDLLRAVHDHVSHR